MCLAAASVGLPIALVSIAKVFLFVAGPAILLTQKPYPDAGVVYQNVKRSALAVVLVLAAFAVSLLWTTASESSALASLGKYGKLLLIPLVALLIRTRQEAVVALKVFILVQVFGFLSSWMLFMHLPVPWATSPAALLFNAPFSHYLDQSIMCAVSAAICWHLRELGPGKYGKQIFLTITAGALVTVFFVFRGMTGYLVAIAMITLAIMWQIPLRARFFVLLVPFLLTALAITASPIARNRILLVKSEISAFSSVEGASVVGDSSSGIRLHFWNRAVQSIAERPLKGSGVGSWSDEFNRLESRELSGGGQKIRPLGNPHQEYLLWGVQLGIPGILLFVAMLVTIFRDTCRLDRASARSAQSVLVALAVSCLFNSTIYDALIGDFFCVLLGLLLALGSCKVVPIQASETAPQNENRKGKSAGLSTWRRVARVWPYFSASRSAWTLAIGATLVAAATEPFLPALMKPLLDRGFQKGGIALWMVPVSLMLLFTIRGLSGFVAQYALAEVTNNGMQALRKAMFDKLLSARLSLFTDQTSSAISNTLVYEVYSGSATLNNALIKMARDILTLLALVGYLLYLNWKLMLVVSLLFPAVALVIQLLTRRFYRLAKESQEATDNLAYVVEENVLAHRDVRLHGAQGSQASRFDALSRSLRRLSMKSTVAYASMSAINQVLAAIALSAVISIALVQGSANTTTVGGFVAFVTAMLLLIAPIKGLSDGVTPITLGLAALERGLDLMDLTEDELGGTFVKARADGDIEFADVSVLYKTGAALAVDRLSLSIKAGETVALVGASGSGKTTLVNLLPRFTEASSGNVYLDGKDLNQWSLASLRSQFALVSQHVVLLNNSIAFNVTLGQSFDRDKVMQALNAANLGSMLAALPDGMDTVLGHNAMQLSGGQRQRLAIARALYKDAPILIFDEATSALDTESEQAVQEAIKRLTSNRTSLIIAHRLSTVQHADRIIMMNAGRIIESGSHAELLAQNGAYAHLYRLGLNPDSAIQKQ